MGNCVKINSKELRLEQTERQSLNIERQLIGLLYRDLSCRSANHLLSRDTFEHFFHLNGLWGEAVFNAFDNKKVGSISYENFECMLKMLAKGNIDPLLKADVLFRFYDIYCNNMVSYQELIKMFYSYPKDELMELFNEKAFHDSLTVRHQLELLRTSTNEESEGEEQIIEEDLEEVEPISAHSKKQSLCIEAEDEFIAISPTDSVKSAQFSVVAQEFEEASRFTYKINVMIKKYAEYLFKEFGLDHRTNSLNRQQFGELVAKHPKLYDSYLEGFHPYIWQCNAKGVPTAIQEKAWVEGELIQRLANEPPKHWYVRFVQEALLIYHDREVQVPTDIIFLPGMIVANYKNSSNQLGFTIRHQDGFYPQRLFMMTDNRYFKQWIHHFQAYFNTSVQEKYTFKEEIGAGSHSIVLRCVKKHNQKEYALKIIDKQKLTDIEKELIRSEVDIMSKCNHPNIIRLKETFETKTHLYIVTELIKDGDLFDFITERGRCSQQEAATVAEDVLQTVRYLNELGLVHRDLKAENLMILLDPTTKQISKCKIIDFGFAIYIDTLKDKSPKERFVGTPNYTAPEILNRKHLYDAKVDMFSIGVIVYFMLCGDLPFNSVDPDMVFENTRLGRYTMAGSRWKTISEDAKHFIRRLLQTNPKDRMSVSEALQHSWLSNRQQIIASEPKIKKADSRRINRPPTV